MDTLLTQMFELYNEGLEHSQTVHQTKSPDENCETCMQIASKMVDLTGQPMDVIIANAPSPELRKTSEAVKAYRERQSASPTSAWD